MESRNEKQPLRSRMQSRRAALSREEQESRSAQIIEQIVQSALYDKNQRICIYQAFRNEVSCDTMKQKAWEDGKEIYVPVTDEKNKTMEFYRITPATQWQTGAYGIMEPVLEEDTPRLTEPALILMPGLVFDHHKHRIGYGGGYYDKYLSSHPMHITAALCYDFQIVPEELPFEEHDILPDYIVTEQYIIQ